VQDRIRPDFCQIPELGQCLQGGPLSGSEQPEGSPAANFGTHVGEILWKARACVRLRSILKNPAYAGAFAYGRRVGDPARQVRGDRDGQATAAAGTWLALVKDVYPAYIRWAEYEQIQKKIAENWQKMRERMSRASGNSPGSSLLVGLCAVAIAAMPCAWATRARESSYILQRGADLSMLGRRASFLSGPGPSMRQSCKSSFAYSNPPRSTRWRGVRSRQAEHLCETLRHTGAGSDLGWSTRRGERSGSTTMSIPRTV